MELKIVNYDDSNDSEQKSDRHGQNINNNGYNTNKDNNNKNDKNDSDNFRYNKLMNASLTNMRFKGNKSGAKLTPNISNLNENEFDDILSNLDKPTSISGHQA